MKKNYKKQIILSITVIFLTLLFIFSFTSCNSKSTEEIETFEVVRGNIVQTVTTSGYVDANQQKNYSLQASGEVLRVLQKGDSFKKSDIIVEINNSRTKLLVEQAEENLNIAKTSIELAKISYQQALDANHVAIQLADENAKLSEQSVQNALVSLEDANRYLSAIKQHSEIPSYQKEQASSSVDAAEGAYSQAPISQSITYWSNLSSMENASSQMEITARNIKQAESQVSLSEISLELAKLDLNNNIIYAPFNGVVLSSAFSEGEYGSSGINAISIISNDFVIKADINETDITKLSTGNEVEITLDAYPGDTFTGSIVEISPISQNLAGIVSFEVTVKPEESGSRTLLYDLSANLTITTSKTENILYIPIESLYEEDSRSYVYTLTEDGEIEEVAVTTGIYNYDYIEIKKGLSEGDIIITSSNIEDIKSSDEGGGILKRFTR